MGKSPSASTGNGTHDDPWILRHRPEPRNTRCTATTAPTRRLVCQVGSTKLRYLARCLDDVPVMLRAHGDWMELGSADENKPAKDGTLEAGLDRKRIRSAAGTGCARATAAALPCTCRRCSNISVSSSWNTSRRTTASAPSDAIGDGPAVGRQAAGLIWPAVRTPLRSPAVRERRPPCRRHRCRSAATVRDRRRTGLRG